MKRKIHVKVSLSVGNVSYDHSISDLNSLTIDLMREKRIGSSQHKCEESNFQEGHVVKDAYKLDELLLYLREALAQRNSNIFN